MKRIITLLLIGMLAFSAFASTTTTLNINANVAKINPTYALKGSITYGKGTASTTTTVSTTQNITEGHSDTLTADGIRLTSNTDSTKDDNQFIVEVSLIQNESRWAGDVDVTFNFSKITYDINASENQPELPKGTYETKYPTEVTATNRKDTIALEIGTLNTDNLASKGDCSLQLTYTVFGYFIKSGITVTTLTATYDIPDWNDDDVDSNGYFPFGTYSGRVTVTITDRT